MLQLHFTENDYSFEAHGLKIDRTCEHIVASDLPRIFVDIQEEEYNKLIPLACKMFVAATKRQQIFLNPAKYTNATDEEWEDWYEERPYNYNGWKDRDPVADQIDYLHEKLYGYHVIQADETPVLVNRDGRPAGSKSYMWVYRSGYLYEDRQIVLYEYQKTRNASHPREFLKNYSGVCVTDGYQVYHTVEKELESLRIAGCWVHCRRKFEEALKVVPKGSEKESLSYLIMKQIQAIYR